MTSQQTTNTCHILYSIVQWNRWFANSDVPFQSVINDLLHSKFAMQTYPLHQVDVTSELLHSWWFVHAQSNNETINVFTKRVHHCRTVYTYIDISLDSDIEIIYYSDND